MRMNPLLEQFISEARDFLQGIGEKLMELENEPGNAELMTELFRFVHTLKGNSGLFEFPEMTRVLHAGEDLMDAVRHGKVEFTKELADRLLDAMDFVGMLCDDIDANGGIDAKRAGDSARLAESLRQLNISVTVTAALPEAAALSGNNLSEENAIALAGISEVERMAAYRRACEGETLHWLDYSPAEECFFQGDDPFFQARGTPDLVWVNIAARQPLSELAELDAYRCVLDFQLLTSAPRAELDEYYRYMPDQIRITPVSALFLALPQGDPNGGPVYEDFVVEALGYLESGRLADLAHAARSLIELSSPDLWLSSALRWLLLVMELEPQNKSAFGVLIASLRDLNPPQWAKHQAQLSVNELSKNSMTQEVVPAAYAVTLTHEEALALRELIAVQREILLLPIGENWQLGRLKSVAATIAGCLKASGDQASLPGLAAATEMALDEAAALPLLVWFDAKFQETPAPVKIEIIQSVIEIQAATNPVDAAISSPLVAMRAASDTEGESKFGRRSEDVSSGPKSLKVDQAKIDRLMNLIGEMVVSKNALPYLAGRAENVFGVRELSREIKTQYSVINRIAEEMQDAIMQVRMMPVSFVFQRFPRLVRDTSRKLGKEVNLVLEGEETEADKNIIESLGDPLVHIVRNSLDHGFEQTEVRRALGKPLAGTLTIRARQESDRVVIEISDDGKGIDPTAVKQKAYEKGIIDEATMERLSDQEAINLVFASGFSTMEVVSDLSGRGVGMDVVRAAVEKVNGTVVLESTKGKGTRIRLSLPLSMAVTNVMIVEFDGQNFGIPMDSVVETVRVPRNAIRTIKKSLATVLRGRIVPLKSINTLLGLDAQPKANAEDELAVLVVRFGDEFVGLLVDDFRETVDIILKPMTGVLSGLSAYSGSALMGDGSVLMVLNIKEVL
jgi:two-component system chemotaxis sensor kinase CheA